MADVKSKAAVAADERKAPPGLLPGDSVEETPAGLRMVASKCEKCGTVTYPMSEICHKCWSSSFAHVHLSTKGKLYSFSIVHIAPRPWHTPYAIGYVDLPDNVRVLSHIKADNLADIAIDMPVELGLGEVGEQDGKPIRSFVFKAVS
jgi:uncharacterized OB-fold protein